MKTNRHQATKIKTEKQHQLKALTIQGGRDQVKEYKKIETEMINFSFVTFILLLLHVISGSTNETDSRCVPVLKVPRNTVFKAHVMTELKINCTVTLYGCQKKPNISWCKLFGDKCEAFNPSDYIKTEWKNIKEQEGISFLIFKNISMEDTGLYRCKESDTSISHAINVTVTEDNKKNEFMSSPTPSNTQNEQQCIPKLKVPRNTMFQAHVMTELKINCTVTLHGCRRKPNISWCKIFGDKCGAFNHSDNIKTKWKNITEKEGMSFLIFKNISMEDTGLYRCKEGDTSISHAINVTVTVQPWRWSFVYIYIGIIELLFIVLTLSLLYIFRFQGRKSSRKYMANKNQDIETQNYLLLHLNSSLLTSVVYRR